MSDKDDPFGDWRDEGPSPEDQRRYGSDGDAPEPQGVEVELQDREQRHEREAPVAGHGVIQIGFIGLPNSGKTSFIHAVRNSTAAMGRGYGVWDFGGIKADSGNLDLNPDGSGQAATPSGTFRRAPFCRIRRVRFRLGHRSLAWPERTLVMPEVAGEISQAIARGSEHAGDVSNTAAYKRFLADSPGILCFVSLDGGYASNEGGQLDPEREIQRQILDIRRVLEAADELREASRGWFRRPAPQAVSVLITKIDMLRELPHLDRVSLPAKRSAVHRCAQSKRRLAIREELKRHGSRDQQVTFSVWDMVTHDAASRDLDLQEAIAADFLKCHAPDSARAMADLQRDISRRSRRSVRFFLVAPYGRSFTSRKKGVLINRKPDPAELRPVLLFEPLESVIERASAAQSRVATWAIPLLLFLVLFSPILTFAALRFASAAMESPGRSAESLLWRANLVGMCPQVIGIEFVPGVAGWYPQTCAEVADCYRRVAANVEQLGDRQHAPEVRQLREAAMRLHEDRQGDETLFRMQADEVWAWLAAPAPESASKAGKVIRPPETLAWGTLRRLSEGFDAHFADWRARREEARASLKRLDELVKPYLASHRDAADALLRRSERLQAWMDLDAMGAMDAAAILKAAGNGQATREAESLLAKMDAAVIDSKMRLRDEAHKPIDLAGWPGIDRTGDPSWHTMLQPVHARESIRVWLGARADALVRAARDLGTSNRVAVLQALPVVEAECKQTLRERDVTLPAWCPTWDGVLTAEESRSIETLREIDTGFALRAGIESDPVGTLKNDEGRLRAFLALPWQQPRNLSMAGRTVDASAIVRTLRGAIGEDLARRLEETGVSDPAILAQATGLFPDNAAIGQIVEVTEMLGGLRSRIAAGQDGNAIAQELDLIASRASARDATFRARVAKGVIEQLLNGDPIAAVARLNQLGVTQRDKADAALRRLEPAVTREFGQRVVHAGLVAARAAAERGDWPDCSACLQTSLSFGDARDGRWRDSGGAYLASVASRFAEAGNAQELEQRKINADVKLLNELALMRKVWPAGENPSALAAAVGRQCDLIRNFDLVKVRGDGKATGAVWIGRHEVVRGKAEQMGIPGLSPRGTGLGIPESALFNSDTMPPVGPLEQRLAQLGLRLPTRNELVLAESRRKSAPGAGISARELPDGRHPDRFTKPESLDAIDRTNEGVVGLVFGVDELCIREGKLDVFQGRPNIPGKIGFRVALDEAPDELATPRR